MSEEQAVLELDSDPEPMEKTFGDTGRWRPLYVPERAITELTDEHLVNATLWIDGVMSRYAKQGSSYRDTPSRRWEYICYLVGKSDELKAEAFRRGISVPVGKEPPRADAYVDKT